MADLDRRRFLTLGALGTAALLTGCDDGGPSSAPNTSEAATGIPPTTAGQAPTTTSATTATTVAPPAATPPGLTAMDFADLAVCRLTPTQAEGPFWLDGDLRRRDITEGRPGAPLRVGLQVVDADCIPIEGAAVDLWHADADGDYSAFLDDSAPDEEGPGSTFLRGTQVTDAQGVVEFATVFPGWYPGRTVHLHVKAFVGGRDVLTTQLYFDDGIADAVFATAPYTGRDASQRRRNADDGIAGDVDAAGLVATVTDEAEGVRLARHVLGVDA